MAQNITLMGASYSDVPAVTLPKTGGGTATFTDTSDADAAASDIASGKTAYVDGVKITGTGSGGSSVTVSPLSVTANGTYTAPSGEAYSPVTVNVSGGGGASNVVTGTFTGTTTGAAMDVPLNYSGNGYPIGLLIYPSEGSYSKISSNSFYSTIQRYAVAQFAMAKSNMTTAPRYNSSDSDEGTVGVAYKSSSTTAATLSVSGTAAAYSYSSRAASSSTRAATFKNATTLSVFIASNSYGFMANIEYKYLVLYSE